MVSSSAISSTSSFAHHSSTLFPSMSVARHIYFEVSDRTYEFMSATTPDTSRQSMTLSTLLQHLRPVFLHLLAFGSACLIASFFDRGCQRLVLGGGLH